MLDENHGDQLPLIITSMDRLDLVLGLLASQVRAMEQKALFTSSCRPFHPIRCHRVAPSHSGWCIPPQMSVKGPGVAGIVLTRAGSSVDDRRYARGTVSRIFEGLSSSSLPTMPVLHVDKSLYETMTALSGIRASILPSSKHKLRQCKMLFDK